MLVGRGFSVVFWWMYFVGWFFLGSWRFSDSDVEVHGDRKNMPRIKPKLTLWLQHLQWEFYHAICFMEQIVNLGIEGLKTCHVSRCHPTSHVKPTWLSKSIICKKNLLSNMPIFWISYQNWEQQQYQQSSTFASNDTARRNKICSVFVCGCTWSGVQKTCPFLKALTVELCA